MRIFIVLLLLLAAWGLANLSERWNSMPLVACAAFCLLGAGVVANL